ncbi:MAG: hypothetical protein U0573_12610 [Phycisphaerales bacterium]|nr:hypothetical protein [Planctomycetota bacterium]
MQWIRTLADSTDIAVPGWNFFSKLFDTDDFPARWECGNWDPPLGWLHIISDLAIFFAYAAIPLSLILFILRRRDIALRGILWLFVAFILFCGCTHLTDAMMFYHPAYRFLGLMKLMTAAVSLATVAALIHVLPEALALPGAAAAHRLAQAEIEKRKVAEAVLIAARNALEQRGAHLTSREFRMQRALIASGQSAVSWIADSGQILWSSGLNELAGFSKPDQPVASWLQLISSADFRRLLQASLQGAAEKQNFSIDLPATLPDGTRTTLRVRAVPDPSTDPVSLSALVSRVEQA